MWPSGSLTSCKDLRHRVSQAAYQGSSSTVPHSLKIYLLLAEFQFCLITNHGEPTDGGHLTFGGFVSGLCFQTKLEMRKKMSSTRTPKSPLIFKSTHGVQILTTLPGQEHWWIPPLTPRSIFLLMSQTVCRSRKVLLCSGLIFFVFTKATSTYISNARLRIKEVVDSLTMKPVWYGSQAITTNMA